MKKQQDENVKALIEELENRINQYLKECGLEGTDMCFYIEALVLNKGFIFDIKKL